MNDLSFDSLNDLLENEKSTVESILTNEHFEQALKCEYEPLLNFLRKDESILNLSKWCFDPKVINDAKFYQYSKIAIQVFTSSIPSVFQIFIENHVFANVMHEFLVEESIKYPVFCGFLNRILSQQIRWGEPVIFKDFLDVGVLLIKGIESIAIQDLMVTIATHNNITMFQEMNLILILSEIMISEMSAAAATTIQQIYDNINDDSPIFNQFKNSQVIQNIIDFCISSKYIVLTSDLLDVAIQIVQANMELFPLIEKKKKIFQLRKDNITYNSVLMIPLFIKDITQLFSLYFEPDAYPKLHQYCSVLIPNLKPEEIIAIARIPRFIDRLIKIHGTDQWCHHMTQIVIVFARILPIYDNFNNKKWGNFLNTVVKNMIRILEEPYGGELPEDEFFSPDDAHEEEEEEEEEDINDSLSGELDVSDDDENENLEAVVANNKETISNDSIGSQLEK